MINHMKEMSTSTGSLLDRTWQHRGIRFALNGSLQAMLITLPGLRQSAGLAVLVAPIHSSHSQGVPGES